MPKVKWGFDASEPEDVGTFEDYDGPVPPTGVYSGVLKRLGIKKNKNGDDMINGLIEIAEPRGSEKAKYNGYAMWFNNNLTAQGLPYFKPFIANALGLQWSDFVNNTVTESDDRPTQIVKIGRVKIQDGDVPVRFSAKKANDAQYGERLENPRFLAKKDAEDSAPVTKWGEDAADAADDDDAPF